MIPVFFVGLLVAIRSAFRMGNWECSGSAGACFEEFDKLTGWNYLHSTSSLLVHLRIRFRRRDPFAGPGSERASSYVRDEETRSASDPHWCGEDTDVRMKSSPSRIGPPRARKLIGAGALKGSYPVTSGL